MRATAKEFEAGLRRLIKETENLRVLGRQAQDRYQEMLVDHNLSANAINLRLSSMLKKQITDGESRADAAINLMKAYEAGDIDGVLELATSGDLLIAPTAVEALGYMGDPRAIAPLTQLRDTQPSVLLRQKLDVALAVLTGTFDEPAAVVFDETQDTETLLSLLGHADRNLRAKAAKALGDRGDKRAVAPLIAAMTDKYMVVRWQATIALGKLGDAQAVDAVIAALKDSNRDVRRSAATALGKLGDTRAAAALNEALLDEWDQVRESAEAALRKLHCAPDIALLLAALESDNSTARHSAIVALGKSGNSEAVAPLIALLESEPAILDMPAPIPFGDAATREARQFMGQMPGIIQKIAIVEALGALADRRAIEPLIRLLPARDSVLLSAIPVLGHLGDARAVEPLITLIKESVGHSGFNEQLRYAAAEALGHIGDKRALVLLNWMQHNDDGTFYWGSLERHRVKDAATAAIARIKQGR